MTVGPGVPAPGDQEPAIDLDVEEDQGREGQESQQDGPRHVHVVLDVDRIVPKEVELFKQFEVCIDIIVTQGHLGFSIQ